MIDDEKLLVLVRSAIPPVSPADPPRDAWSRLASRGMELRAWSWVDLAVAAASLATLVVRPELVIALLYHF